MSNSATEFSPSELASYIDHTILRADARKEEVERYCHEAIEYGFFSVCVNPFYVPLVAKNLKGSTVKTCSVIGFPLGTIPTELKANEAAWAVSAGANEIDMVIEVGALKDGDYDFIRSDIAQVKKACGTALLKVIIETCLLSDEEKKIACALSKEAGADYVKTSTGFSTGGATASDVALMRATVGPEMGVKASGGVRTYQDAITMIKAGASRIGASSSIAIVTSN
ncbi:deoxyribose-phosphate aldolase [Microvirga sp. W0021]|uniref:Deoxyribose-phosphate aldolase n=1 Tax=Hohaiivirga grylli TaxID=3133970 RepID=A0ABV0BFW3_9HYPH